MVVVHELSKTSRRQRAALACALLCLAASSHAESVDGRDFDCLLEPKTRVMLGSPTQGVIRTVDVRRGESVEKGQIIATLDARLEKAELKHARMRAKMTSEIKAREADVELAQVTFERVKNLSERNMAPAQQLDEARAALKVATMTLARAQDGRKLLEQEYARAREAVEQHVIRSPITGVVVEQIAYPGEFVHDNPIAIIAQVDPLKVEAILPARFFGGVRVGLPSTIWPEIDSAGPIDVQIASVDQVIDSASGTFSVHLEVPNPNNGIPGGQRCRLAFGDVDPDAMADRYAANR